jgi:hypothetical protein
MVCGSASVGTAPPWRCHHCRHCHQQHHRRQRWHCRWRIGQSQGTGSRPVQAQAQPRPWARALPLAQAQAQLRPWARGRPLAQTQEKPQPWAPALPLAHTQAQPRPWARALPLAQTQEQPRPWARALPLALTQEQPRQQARLQASCTQARCSDPLCHHARAPQDPRLCDWSCAPSCPWSLEETGSRACAERQAQRPPRPASSTPAERPQPRRGS